MKVKDITSKLKNDGTEVVIFKKSYRHADEEDAPYAWYMRIYFDDENSSLELGAVPNDVMELDVLLMSVDVSGPLAVVLVV